jgi:hypothetical protein
VPAQGAQAPSNSQPEGVLTLKAKPLLRCVLSNAGCLITDHSIIHVNRCTRDLRSLLK